MREIVIVLADLYLPAVGDAHARRPPASDFAQLTPDLAAPPLPGLEHVARFGARAPLPNGWRGWLAGWLGRPQLAGVPPAHVAAAALGSGVETQHAWIATPMHLVAGLTALHLDWRGILWLTHAELERLAVDFHHAFGDLGLALRPLGARDLLLLAPNLPASVTTEPARCLIEGLADCLPAGAGGARLRHLAAELEMWLHRSPLNEARERRNEQPVNALWLWGGGAPQRSDAALAATHPEATPDRDALAFASDAYVRGLWRDAGGELQPLPERLGEVLGYPRTARAAVVVEIAQVLNSHPDWTVLGALADLDRRFITPAMQGLHRGELQQLTLLANDRSITLRSTDRLKFWRRARAGLEALR